MENTSPSYLAWLGIEYKPTVSYYEPKALLPTLSQGMTVLEIGCNVGQVCRLLADEGCHVTGVDINEQAICTAQSLEPADRRVGSVVYTAGDFLAMAPPEPHDVVVMIRLLTCIPRAVPWGHMLDAAMGCVKEGGLIYVLDFVRVDDSQVYASRYRAGEQAGYRRGAFDVPGPDGEVEYVAFHHDEAAITRIRSPYDEVAFSQFEGQSKNGNLVKMFEFLGRKRERP